MSRLSIPSGQQQPQEHEDSSRSHSQNMPPPVDKRTSASASASDSRRESLSASDFPSQTVSSNNRQTSVEDGGQTPQKKSGFFSRIIKKSSHKKDKEKNGPNTPKSSSKKKFSWLRGSKKKDKDGKGKQDGDDKEEVEDDLVDEHDGPHNSNSNSKDVSQVAPPRPLDYGRSAKVLVPAGERRKSTSQSVHSMDSQVVSEDLNFQRRLDEYQHERDQLEREKLQMAKEIEELRLRLEAEATTKQKLEEEGRKLKEEQEMMARIHQQMKQIMLDTQKTSLELEQERARFKELLNQQLAEKNTDLESLRNKMLEERKGAEAVIRRMAELMKDTQNTTMQLEMERQQVKKLLQEELQAKERSIAELSEKERAQLVEIESLRAELLAERAKSRQVSSPTAGPAPPYESPVKLPSYSAHAHPHPIHRLASMPGAGSSSPPHTPEKVGLARKPTYGSPVKGSPRSSPSSSSSSSSSSSASASSSSSSTSTSTATTTSTTTATATTTSTSASEAAAGAVIKDNPPSVISVPAVDSDHPPPSEVSPRKTPRVPTTATSPRARSLMLNSPTHAAAGGMHGPSQIPSPRRGAMIPSPRRAAPRPPSAPNSPRPSGVKTSIPTYQHNPVSPRTSSPRNTARITYSSPKQD